MRNGLLSKWTMHTDQAACCELPKDVADAFHNAVVDFSSMKFEPVLFVGSKSQNGMYYCLICKTTETVEPRRQDFKIVYIYQSTSGASTVTRIEDVLFDR